LGIVWAMAHPAVAALLILALLPIWLPFMLLVLVARHQPHEYWPRYWVVEQVSPAQPRTGAKIIACGRIDRGDYHSELYDLYVLPPWRGQGVGQVLVQRLAEEAGRPLYLACLPQAMGFYQRFGFVPIAQANLPYVLQARLSLLNPRLTRLRLQAMVLETL
jgi:GNAT superfamily N-acetyltransferase